MEITAISDRSGAAINPNGLDLQQALDTKEKTGKINLSKVDKNWHVFESGSTV